MLQDKRGYSQSGSKKKTGQIDIPLTVAVPEGDVLLGTSDAQIQYLLRREVWAQEWYDSDMFQIEQPQHAVHIPAFEIGLHPVTNFDYYQFVYFTGYRIPRGWLGLHYFEGQADHPVTGVSLADALAYCEWFSKEAKFAVRLPNEAEWERAARGSDERIYPWGDNFDPWRCNTVESNKRSTTPITSYSPSGDSPFGASDMVGNVWEWTTSLLMPYPYDPTDGREDLAQEDKRVVRGGAWYYSRKLARCSAREGVLADYVSPSLGFRIVHPVE